MTFTVTSDDDRPIEFECFPGIVSRWVSQEILAGRTYPVVPFVDDVRVVVDVGANCGAFSVYSAHHYPDAAIHAVEPGSEPRALLERNAANHSNIRVHPVGLHATDAVVPLYKGGEDSILGSIHRRDINTEESEPVQLRAGGGWAAEHGIERMDVLKVDVEGCEVDVLRSLEELLPTVKVLYVEYDSRQARRDIDHLLGPTHELYRGILFLEQGEITYLRRDLADHSAAQDHLRTVLASMQDGAQG